MRAHAVSADGRYLATSLPIKLWDLSTGQQVAKSSGWGHGDLAFSPAGDLLASAEWLGGVRLFRNPSGELLDRLPTEEEKQALGPSGPTRFQVNMPVSTVEFSPNGALPAAAGADRKVRLWGVSNGQVNKTAPRTLAGHRVTVVSLSFSPDGRHLASGSLDRTIRLWPLQSEKSCAGQRAAGGFSGPAA